MLSWLVAAGIRSLPQDAKLIFPNPKGQPLLHTPIHPDSEGILIPNLPNIFIAEIGGEPKQTARAVQEAIEGEWEAIAKAVWDKRHVFHLPDATKAVFDAQVSRHLSISWQATPLQDSYSASYRLNGWHLDAVRQTRDFKAWLSTPELRERDSLTGKEEALIGGKEYQEKCLKKNGEYASLFSKHDDRLGAVSIIKRCWHLAYLRDEDKPRLKTGSRDFEIRSVPAIAARIRELDDEKKDDTGKEAGKYIAAIAFDGDSIGKWVNGEDLDESKDLRQHHQDFSRSLSNFAMQVRGIVEKLVEEKKDGKDPSQVPLGQLIYAGGDDVLCLVPADAALAVASELREDFLTATSNIKGKCGATPDASVGIAIAHIHSPLQDLIREAQKAQKFAKNNVGRPSFAITLMKRSGEISQWGSQWETGGYELYQKIDRLLAGASLSPKFPHRVCELLEPYCNAPTPLMKKAETLQDVNDFDAKEIIIREFHFAIARQSPPGKAEVNARILGPGLKAYLEGVVEARKRREECGKKSELPFAQELITSVIGLCTAVAFAHRNRPSH